MADFNYVKSQRTADKLISKFGGKLGGKIFRPTLGTGPKSNPGKGVPQMVPCTCCVVDYTTKERQESNIERTSKRMLVSPLNLPVEIKLTDEIEAPDGSRYKIVPPMSILKPRDVIVLYDLQVQA